jgi:hypothetical protein
MEPALAVLAAAFTAASLGALAVFVRAHSALLR